MKIGIEMEGMGMILFQEICGAMGMILFQKNS